MKATWFQQPLAFLWHLETKRMVWSVLVAIKWDWRAEFWFKQGLSGKECRKNTVMKRLVSSYTVRGIISGNELLQHQTFYFFLTAPGLIMYKVSVMFMWFSDCEVWKEWPSPCCRKFLTQHSLGCGNRTSTAFRHFSTRSLLLGADHDIGNFKRRCHKLGCDFKPQHKYCTWHCTRHHKLCTSILWLCGEGASLAELAMPGRRAEGWNQRAACSL